MSGSNTTKIGKTVRPSRPPPKKAGAMRVVVPVLVLLVMLAAAGGWWAFGRTMDPLQRADQLAAKGDMRGALIEFRNAVREQPKNARAHLRLGETQLKLSDPVAAEKEIEAARDLGADPAAVTVDLGRVYLALGRFKDVLTEVPASGPTPDVTAQHLMLRSIAQVNLHDMDAARASMDGALKAAPGDVQVLLSATRLGLMSKDLKRARETVDAALKIDPNELDGMLMKSQILDRSGDKAGALALLDKAVSTHPDSAPARLDRANQLILAGQDAKAKADVDAVLKMQKTNAGATYLDGVLLVRAGKYAEAQTELLKLTPVMQRFPRAWYFLALAATNLGQTEIAIDYANRYAVRVPEDEDGARLLARTELAANRPQLAVTTLERAVERGTKDGQTLDLLGRAYALLGQQTKAVEAFRQAIAASPNDPVILTHLASAQMREGDPSQATAALRKSLELKPKQPQASEALVAASLSAGDISGAEAALATLRKEQGDSEAVGVMSGMVALAKLDLDGAREAFAATVKRFPDSVDATLNLAKVLILQGRKPEGEALLKEIVGKKPANVPALSTLVQVLVQETKFPEALDAVKAARKAAPKDVGLVSLESDLMVKSGDAKGAIGLLQEERGGGVLPPILMAALARAQVAAGRPADAEETYATMLKAAPTDLSARQAQVDLLLRADKPAAAEAALREALSASPGNLGIMTSMVELETRTNGADAGLKLAGTLRDDTSNLPNSSLLRGDALMRAKRYADAQQAFLTEDKLAPSAPLVLRMASALNAQNKDAEAQTYLHAWQAQDKENPDVALMISLIDIRMNNLDEAEKELGVVLAKRPADVVALNNLAWVYQKKGDPQRARTLAQRAYLQRPTPETADTLGWIMVQTGDAKSGVPLLQKASGQRPDNGAILYHLAVGLNDIGRKDEAVKVLQPIVRAAPDFDGKDAARTLLSKLTPNK